MRRILALIILTCSLNSGCSMFQWAMPHQLWKLNRQPALGNEEAYFCIPAEATSGPSSTEMPSHSAESAAR